ncbi:MAG: hypothetical protein RLZZ490_1987, partial [Cyanobacteriota bacterium]
TLGTEAFKWFAPYGQPGEVDEFFQGGDRFQSSLDITLMAKNAQGQGGQRPIKLMPLPHPSPLNKRYYAQFPQMLQQRLANIAF